MHERRLKLAEQNPNTAPSGVAMDRAAPATPRWRRRVASIPIVLLTIGFALLLLFRPSHVQVVDSPRLATVIAGEFVDELALRARVEPLQSVQLDAVEAGRVEAVFAQDGAQVLAGA